MTDGAAIVQAIQSAARRRTEAAAMRREATDELRRSIEAAQQAGISITRIADLADLSRQGVYDLISAQPSQ